MPVARNTSVKISTMPGLDALRFISACSVMAFHLSVCSWALGNTQQAALLDGRASYREAFPFAWFGWIGVEVFFVISGIVIARSAASSGPVRFLAGRAARLYPAAMICACLSAALLVASGLPASGLVPRMARSIALWPWGPWLDDVYWTLGIEMAFYLLVAGFLFLGQRHRLSWLGTGLGLASAAYWLVGLALDARYPMSLMWERWAELSLVPYGCYFGLGMTVALRKGRRPLAGWLPALPMLAGCYAEIHFKALHASATAGIPLSPIAPWAAFSAALAVACHALRNERVTAGPRADALRSLGLATYPLYLIHNVAGPMGIAALVDAGADRWAALALASLGCIVVSFPIAAWSGSATRAMRPRPSPSPSYA